VELVHKNDRLWLCAEAGLKEKKTGVKTNDSTWCVSWSKRVARYGSGINCWKKLGKTRSVPAVSAEGRELKKLSVRCRRPDSLRPALERVESCIGKTNIERSTSGRRGGKTKKKTDDKKTTGCRPAPRRAPNAVRIIGTVRRCLQLHRGRILGAFRSGAQKDQAGPKEGREGEVRRGECLLGKSALKAKKRGKRRTKYHKL